MPTYQYVCSKCEHEFELFQSMKDKPLAVCPKELCGQKTWGKGKVKRMIGAGAGLIFKGSGFYITDYRSKAYTEAAKKDSASASSSSGDSKSSSTSASTSGNGRRRRPKPKASPPKPDRCRPAWLAEKDAHVVGAQYFHKMKFRSGWAMAVSFLLLGTVAASAAIPQTLHSRSGQFIVRGLSQRPSIVGPGFQSLPDASQENISMSGSIRRF